MDINAVHRRIKKIRKETNASQEEMADMMGVGRSTFINFEAGRTKAISDNLFKFAEVCNVDVESILLGDEYGDYLREGIDYKEKYEELQRQYERMASENEKLLAKKDKEIENLKIILEKDTELMNSLRQMLYPEK